VPSVIHWSEVRRRLVGVAMTADVAQQQRRHTTRHIRSDIPIHGEGNSGQAQGGGATYSLAPGVASDMEVVLMPGSRANVKNEKQYEALKDKGMSKSRAARIANSEGSSSRGGKASGSGKKNSDSSQGGTTAQKKEAGRKGGKATAKKS
jgi:hypothetical protein